MTQLNQTSRVQALDILRGLVMVLMAIDHVRVYSGIPAGGPAFGIFITRWVTHFCAPAFVFFAGTSAFLYGLKVVNIKSLKSFLISRGLLLIILEFTFIRFCWTFNFDYGSFTLAGVIWMLGCSMIFLSFIVNLKPMAITIIGLVIVFFQQFFGLIPKLLPDGLAESFSRVWSFVYPSALPGADGITILYVLVPWIGVIAAGYGFGALLLMEPSKRNSWCLKIGLGATALFLVAAILLASLNENPNNIPLLIRVLSQQKYPASQLFLLMTLGPMIALIPFADRLRGWFADVLNIFGKVPMFYYLLHIPLIHVLALITNLILTGVTNQEFYRTAPYVSVPPENRWNLSLLYLIFVVSVFLLYFACKWYVRFKENNRHLLWTKYI